MSTLRNSSLILTLLCVSIVLLLIQAPAFAGSSCDFSPLRKHIYYVKPASEGGSDGNFGTEKLPWATISHALTQVEDNSTIIVKPGVYEGRIQVRGAFFKGVVVRSEKLYQAKLRSKGQVMTLYGDVQGITIEGFDFSHSSRRSEPLLIHMDGDGRFSVQRITLRHNIIHNSQNNDLLKVNNSIKDVLIERNIFYNQSGSDEHIDLNGIKDVVVQDNIFFNDFNRSERVNLNNTSSFIGVKDSNGSDDQQMGSENITIKRNVFLGWQGGLGSCFVIFGEDGLPVPEAFDSLVENNLMLGNSDVPMRSPFCVKGARDITFRNNTVVGDLPSNAYAVRLNTEGENEKPTNIFLYNNIWSDPTGTMKDFSDTERFDVGHVKIDNNLYWNGGKEIPSQSVIDLVNYTSDDNRIVKDPGFPKQGDIIPPMLDQETGKLIDGSSNACEAFDSLIKKYGVPSGSVVRDAANSKLAPKEDIFGNSRGATPDLGAVEL